MSVENDGERIVGNEKNLNSLCHLKRYEFVTSFLTESDIVLDFACGTGYGSAIMAAKAGVVYGYDPSVEAIDHARNNYTKPVFFSAFPAEIRPTVIVGLECLEHLEVPEASIQAFEDMNPRLLILSHPYMEPENNNPHHKHFQLHENSFRFKKRPEIFYQSPNGMIGQTLQNRQNIIYVV